MDMIEIGDIFLRLSGEVVDEDFCQILLVCIQFSKLNSHKNIQFSFSN